MLPTVTAQEMRAAQVFTGATLALWLAIGYVPAIRRHANIVRSFLLGLYFVGCAAFVAYTYLG